MHQKQVYVHPHLVGVPMQLFTSTPASLFNKVISSIDAAAQTQDREPCTTMPFELDSDTLKHVGGGLGDTDTPVVSW